MPENDRLTRTLDSLRAEAERTPMADSTTVRRRGDRRTRNQAVGSALAVVLLVVGAAGLVGGGSGDQRSTDLPATGTPTPTPTESLRQVAAAPFLTAAGLTDLGGYDGIGPFLDAGQAPEVLAEECRARPDGWGAETLKATRFYQDGSEASVYEYVLRFPDQAAAEGAALKRAYADLADCITAVGPGRGDVSTRLSVTVPGLGGDRPGAVRHSRLFVPSLASEPTYYEVATAAEANVVVVLEWSAYGNPSGSGDDAWVWSAERLQVALDRAVGNEP